MKIADKTGKWMINTSGFRFHDPMSNTMFEVGEITKAEDTSWRQANKGVIQLCDEDGNIIGEPGQAPADAPEAKSPADTPEAKPDQSKVEGKK